MELEFDKEMDAILRKARGGGAVAASAAFTPHIDADSIAAFAENSLPPTIRQLYTAHLADCDRCRRVLSGLMLLNPQAEAEASMAVVAPPVHAAVPWYQWIFRTPNLAAAMGALVLVFGGILGFLVVQDRQRGADSTVARVNEPDQMRAAGPAQSENANSMAAANTISQPMVAANTAVPAANAGAQATPASPTSPDTSALKPVETAKGEAQPLGFQADGFVAGKEAPKDEMRPAAAPPVPAKRPELAERDEMKADDMRLASRTEEDREKARKSSNEVLRRADQPPAAAKSGPARSGPLNVQQNQIATQNTAEMPVSRNVAGKTFNNRNGVWYDSAYRSQATLNFRRGTEEYKKLDSGLRKIADTLGGTVVLVWKERAYRIQ